MEKVTINGKEYLIDIEKCKEQELLIEDVKYPKDWEDYHHLIDYGKYSVGFSARYDNSGNELLSMRDDTYDWFPTKEESYAFNALGKLIQLRDWWWDNMCNGWRPDWTNHNESKWTISFCAEILEMSAYNQSVKILAFPSTRIRDMFYETYRDLIEEAKMFL